MQKRDTVFQKPLRAGARLRSRFFKKSSPSKVTMLPSIDDDLEEYNKIKNKDVNRKKLQKLEKLGTRQLLHIQSVFPFMFFPEEIIIDENKITVVITSFFATKNVRSILIKDIANVNVQTSLFFATLQIIDQYFTEDTQQVRYLKKDEAILACRLIQGLMVSRQQNVDYANLSVDEVKTRLRHIGQIRE